ncbi:class I SAM-dependent methyltransferase [Archangium sp.]|uniref:class I SAM-dependent methyltransferase n=1 Tax=Archangium sp. TaxID=1872627 RepID=UPI00389A1D58
MKTEDVRQMYEQHPYPSPIVGDSLIHDLANAIGMLFPDDTLAGWNVLDAGCGTGHRLVSFAQRYPAARFTGVDMTEHSLAVARQLARKHGVSNLELRRGDLLNLELGQKYDLIVSTGVLHHLEDPEAGLRGLVEHLSEEGLLFVWLYHSHGEHQRLLDRELARTLTRGCDMAESVSLMRELGLSLSRKQYGTETAHQGSEGELSQVSIDVDAFLHPIVNAYRFDELLDMLRRTSVDWVTLNGLNTEGASKLVDLEGTSEDPYFCITDEQLFASSLLQERFRQLPRLDRVRVIELALRPTGFTLLAGKGQSFRRCEPRVATNIVHP